MNTTSSKSSGSATRQPVNHINQHRAQIFDRTGTITITSVTANDVQNKLQRLLGGTPRYVPQPDNPTARDIYHDSHMLGEQPIGCVWEQSVPETLSVAQVVERRLEQQKQAA